MKLYDAIKKMRELSTKKEAFSFSFMSFNSTEGKSDGVVEVRRARVLSRESAKHHKNADIIERYLDLDTMNPRHFYQPLLMSLNGIKIEL